MIRIPINAIHKRSRVRRSPGNGGMCDYKCHALVQLSEPEVCLCQPSASLPRLRNAKTNEPLWVACENTVELNTVWPAVVDDQLSEVELAGVHVSLMA